MTTAITTTPIQALFVARNKTKDNIGFVNVVSSSEGAIGVVFNHISFYTKVGGQIFNMGVLRCCPSLFAWATRQSTTALSWIWDRMWQETS